MQSSKEPYFPAKVLGLDDVESAAGRYLRQGEGSPGGGAAQERPRRGREACAGRCRIDRGSGEGKRRL